MADDCDLLVIGSGAAGLSAAVTGAASGLRVIIIEKDSVLGGTTAWSGGWIWAPGNPLAHRAGLEEPFEAPLTYLANVLGPNFDAKKVEAFLNYAPHMIGFLETRAAMQFELGAKIPDTYGHLPNAGTGGRSVIAAPFDGRALGPLIHLLRKPLRETAFMGMTIQAGPDLRAFMSMLRSVKSFGYVSWRFTRHLYDLARFGRGMQLRNGNALAARLIRAAADLGVEFRLSTAATALLLEQGRVAGAALKSAEGSKTVRARVGVVLASGGFSNSKTLCDRFFPAAETHRSLAVPAAEGDGWHMAEAVGAKTGIDVASPGAWCPVSLVPYKDHTAPFPHIIERGKPGLIAVLPNGQRFCNEGLGYHDYVRALLAATPAGQTPESWFICTRAFQRRYGLGISRPAPLPVTPWLRSGYLKSGKTIPDLARACGIDPQGLAATIAEFNSAAAEGKDPAFGRGETLYMRYQGDPENLPNPCVAPIKTGPFYAVRVIPGSFGSFAGIATDAQARVLNEAGEPIAGLYAAGADMLSVMGGHYPAGGINLGPALTFGHIAALHAAGEIETR